jgi:hypothetical protein
VREKSSGGDVVFFFGIGEIRAKTCDISGAIRSISRSVFFRFRESVEFRPPTRNNANRRTGNYF